MECSTGKDTRSVERFAWGKNEYNVVLNENTVPASNIL